MFNCFLYNLLQNVPQIYPFVVDNFFSTLDETRIMQTSGIRGDWRGNFVFPSFFSSFFFFPHSLEFAQLFIKTE